MIECTYQDVIKNFKRNWKAMICIVLICLIIGIICGAINIKHLENIKYSRDDRDNTIIEMVEVSDLERDEAYYENAFNRVKDMRCALVAYLQYLKQVPMSGNSMTKISEMEKLIASYEDSYQELVLKYKYNYPMICTDDSIKYIDEKIYVIENQIESYTSKLKQIEEQIFVGVSSKAKRLELENKINDLYADFLYWEKWKEVLQSRDAETMEYNNALFDEVLSLNLVEINGLVQAFNQLIEDLEKIEQYDIIYNKYLLKGYTINMSQDDFLDEEDALNIKKTEALIYAKSIAGVDSAKESFLAYILFFGMFGVTCAVLYGAFKKGVQIQR